MAALQGDLPGTVDTGLHGGTAVMTLVVFVSPCPSESGCASLFLDPEVTEPEIILGGKDPKLGLMMTSQRRTRCQSMANTVILLEKIAQFVAM